MSSISLAASLGLHHHHWIVCKTHEKQLPSHSLPWPWPRDNRVRPAEPLVGLRYQCQWQLAPPGAPIAVLFFALSRLRWSPAEAEGSYDHMTCTLPWLEINRIIWKAHTRRPCFKSTMEYIYIYICIINYIYIYREGSCTKSLRAVLGNLQWFMVLVYIYSCGVNELIDQPCHGPTFYIIYHSFSSFRHNSWGLRVGYWGYWSLVFPSFPPSAARASGPSRHRGALQLHHHRLGLERRGSDPHRGQHHHLRPSRSRGPARRPGRVGNWQVLAGPSRMQLLDSVPFFIFSVQFFPSMFGIATPKKKGKVNS